MLSITLLLQVPQTIPVRYVFGFVHEIITCRIAFTSSCAVCTSPLVVIFQSCEFQSCKFSYPTKWSSDVSCPQRTKGNNRSINELFNLDPRLLGGYLSCSCMSSPLLGILYPSASVASPGFVARRANKLEIRSWDTHGGMIAGCSSCSMTNSFVTNAVLIERAVSC